MTENNAAQPGLTDDDILQVFSDVVGNQEDDARFIDVDRDQAIGIARTLLSKLRAEGVQAGDERESFSDWAWRKDGLAIGHMDGQAAAWEAWQERARRAALASAPVAGEAQPVGEVFRHGEGRDENGPRVGIRMLPAAAGIPHGTLVYAAPQTSEAVRNAALSGLLLEIEDYLLCVVQGSMSRNNSEALASELGDRLRAALKTQAQTDKDGGDCAKGARDVDLMRFALEAIEAEMDPKWECNSYHPMLRTAADKLRAALPAQKQGDSK